jgi:hypothetical protein
MLAGTLPGLRGSFRLRLASIFNHRPAYRQPMVIILHPNGEIKLFLTAFLRLQLAGLVLSLVQAQPAGRASLAASHPAALAGRPQSLSG